MTKFNILLIEDDVPLAELTSEFLNEFEFTTTWVETGADAKQAVKESQFDLIICDVNLPDALGFDLISEFNLPFNFPILFLTALSDNNSQIHGLNSGACDYIVKPVEPELLLARVRAHLRHSHPAAVGDVIQIHQLHLDNVHKHLEYKGQDVKLTNQEFDLLWFFVSRGDSIIARETIFSDLIGRPYDGADRAADLRISRFRKKMDSLGLHELSIESIRNQGYLFNYWAKTVEAK